MMCKNRNRVAGGYLVLKTESNRISKIQTDPALASVVIGCPKMIGSIAAVCNDAMWVTKSHSSKLGRNSPTQVHMENDR